MIARIPIYIFAAILIAAHFLRMGQLVPVALCLATPALFFLRRQWIPSLLEFLAYAACLIWLWTAWEIVTMRRLFGEPWLRSAIILIAVAAVTALAGAMLRGTSVRQRYRVR